MRDIVERLKEKIIVDAFVSGSISDGALCDRLIRERLDAADEIVRLRAENETLRRDVKTAIMGDSAELTDVKRENEKLREELNCWHEAANWPEKSPHALRAENEKLRAAFRVNMLRAFPHMSHDEIDAEIAAAIRESSND